MQQDVLDCSWPPFDTMHARWMGSSLILVGTLGAVLNGWLVSTVLLSCLLNARTHLLTLNLAIASLGRNLLAGFPFAGTSLLAGRWLFGTNCCQMYAFMRQLFGMSQVFSVALLTVERSVVVRQPHTDSRLPVRMYVIAILSSWTASVAWSLPPLLGWGRYGCDTSGTACDLDWRSSSGVQLSYNLSLLIFGGVLPSVITFTFGWRAVHSHNIPLVPEDPGLDQINHHSLAKALVVLSTSMWLVWLPHALLLLWILIDHETLPLSLQFMAPLGNEASSSIPTLVYLACETRVRDALLGTLTSSRRPRKCPRRSIRLTEIK